MTRQLQDQIDSALPRRSKSANVFAFFGALADALGWVGDLVIGRPGPKTSASRAWFEQKESGGARGRSGAGWSEPVFAFIYPIFPVLFFLAVLVLALSFIVPGWLPAPFGHRAPAPTFNRGVSVWVNQGTGLYTCPGSVLYGHTAGEAMSQMAALNSGYLPMGGVYCVDTPAPAVKPVAHR